MTTALDTGLRVLQVTPGYDPARGGVETHVRQLSHALTSLGVTVEVVTTGRGPVQETRDGIEVRRLPAISPGGNYHFSPALYRYVQSVRGRFDVIHAHNYHSLTTAAAGLAAGETPVVVTPHYHRVGHSRLRNALHIYYRTLGRRLLRKAGAVVAVSAAERRLLLELEPRIDGRCVLIPNGIEDRYLDSGDSDAPLGREEGLLVAVCRLEAYKGAHHIIAALALLPEHFHLMLVGRGPEEAHLRAESIRLGLAGRVSFVSNLDSDELRNLYRRAAVYISLSSLEAFGLTLPEAAACGCPIVASGIPSHRELAGVIKGIKLVRPEEHAAVAAAIVGQADAAGSLRDRERFRWSSIASEIADVYMTVLRQRAEALP